MIRRILASTLIITILGTTTWAAAPGFAQEAPAAEVSHEEATKRLDEFLKLVRELRSHIDRSEFDLEALLEKLDYDAEKIIEFVKEEIYFEPYLGSLRGAQGVLLSRAGNSLDQSLILATLLKDSGFDARIVRGALDERHKRELMTQAKRSHVPLPSAVAYEQVGQSLIKYGSDLRFEDETGDALSDQATDSEPLDQASELVRQNVNLLTTLVPETTSTEVSAPDLFGDDDYFWVEYRPEERAWQAVHPAFAQDKSDEAHPEALQYIHDQLPADLAHRFSFRISVQQGGKEWAPIMPWWERPVANLVGGTYSVAIVPDQFFHPKAKEHPLSSLRDSQFFVPTLNGSVIPGTQAFDLQGRIVPLDALDSVAGYLVKTVGDKAIAANSALSDLGTTAPSKPAFRLSAVRIEWAFRRPGQETPESHERLVFHEEWLAADGDQSAVKEKLASVHWFALDTGPSIEGFLFEASLDLLEGASGALRTALDLDHGKAAASDLNGALQSFPLERPAILSLVDQFYRGLRPEVRTNLYTPEPGLVVLNEPVLPGTGWGCYGVDIVVNSARAFSRSDGQLTGRRDLTMEVGVWQSFVEGWSLDVSGSRGSAFDYLDRLRLEGVKFLAVREPAVLEELDLSAVAKNNLLSDIKSGFVAVVPNSGESEIEGWWRVDPVTGNTLARLAEGTGGSPVAEYLKVGLIAFAGTYWFLKAGSSCLEEGHSSFRCTICGLFAGATAALAVWVLLPSGGTAVGHELIPMIVRRLIYRKNSAGYIKALIVAMGPFADGVCGTKILVK